MKGCDLKLLNCSTKCYWRLNRKNIESQDNTHIFEELILHGRTIHSDSIHVGKSLSLGAALFQNESGKTLSTPGLSI
jgi:hypothetical protein